MKTDAATDSTSIRPGKPWLDTAGNLIQAHGGGMLLDHGVYYWYGENKDAPVASGPGMNRVDVIGVNCYSSVDLVHWQNEGLVLPAVPDDPAHDLHPQQVAERPKVIRHPRSGQYVLFLHIDRPDYEKARVGIAVSAAPTGPFVYQRSIRPAGKDSRDMTVYQDDDGRAYLVFASDRNSSTVIADLTDDYLDTTGHYTTHFSTGVRDTGRESPALFKHQGKYYIITSGTTGWKPNPSVYAVAAAVHGPWEVKDNPFAGQEADTSYHSQVTYVLEVRDQPGDFIAMGDRWVEDDLRNSPYTWLPFRVEDEKITLHWRPEWDLSIFADKGPLPPP